MTTLLRHPGLVAGAGCTELFLASVVRNRARRWFRESVSRGEEGDGSLQLAWGILQACEQFAGGLETSVRSLCGTGSTDVDSEDGIVRSRCAVSMLYSANRSLATWLPMDVLQAGSCSGAVRLQGWHCTRAAPITVLKYRFQGPTEVALCPFQQPEPPVALGGTTATSLTCDEGSDEQPSVEPVEPTPPTPHALAATHTTPLFPLGYSRHATPQPPTSKDPRPESASSSDDADDDGDDEDGARPDHVSEGDAEEDVVGHKAVSGSYFSGFPVLSRRSGVSARVVDVVHTKKIGLQLAVQAAVAILRLRGAVRRATP